MGRRCGAYPSDGCSPFTSGCLHTDSSSVSSELELDGALLASLSDR